MIIEPYLAVTVVNVVLWALVAALFLAPFIGVGLLAYLNDNAPVNTEPAIPYQDQSRWLRVGPDRVIRMPPPGEF